MKMNHSSKNGFVALLFVLVAVIAPSVAFSPQHESLVRGRSPARGPRQLAMTVDPGAKKETTWDRITGPKLFKTVTYWQGIHSVPLVPLRIMTGLLMIHHGTEGEYPLRLSLAELCHAQCLTLPTDRWFGASQFWHT